MSEMNKRKEAFIGFYLLLQPILDSCVTLVPQLYLHIIGRGLFLFYLVFSLVRSQNTRKKAILLLGIMLFYFCYQTFFLHFGVLQTISSVFKFSYLFFIVLFFYSFEYQGNLKKILVLVLLEYVGIYFCSYIFHFGHDIYIKPVKKTGFSGVFHSINEYSAILTILYYYMVYYFRQKPLIVLAFSALLFSVALFTATKVLFGFLTILLLGYFIFQVQKRWKVWKNKQKWGFLVLIVVFVFASLFFFFHSNVYQNMLVQQKFFKVKNIFSFQFVNRIIFNNRFTFLSMNLEYMKHQSLLLWLFGMGYDNPLKLVEIDLFDVLFRYGFVGLSLTVYLFVQLFKKRKENKIQVLAMFILLLISLTSGHILMAPAVSLYFGLSLLLEKEEEKKGKSSSKRKSRLIQKNSKSG